MKPQAILELHPPGVVPLPCAGFPISFPPL